MTKTATLPSIDPWASARASWIPLPGTRAERGQAAQFLKPLLWEHVLSPEDRALVAALAGEVLDAEPGVQHAFAGRLLTRIRVQESAPRSAGERARLHGLAICLSQHLALLPDLLARVRALAVRPPSEESD